MQNVQSFFDLIFLNFFGDFSILVSEANAKQNMKKD